jgi:ATP-binding cassette subfamily B multidrug efflux pump
MDKLRYIKDIILKYLKRYIFGIISIIIVDAMQISIPKIIGKVTEELENDILNRESLLNYAIILAIIGLLIGLFRFIWRYLIIGASKNIEAHFRERLYKKLQFLSANYYNKSKTGDLMAHATNDINNVTVALGMGIALSFDSVIIPVAVFIMMIITVGSKLTLIALVPVILLGIGTFFYVKIMNKRVHEKQEAFSCLTERTRENFSGIRVVKAYAREINEIKKFKKVNLNTKHKNMRYLRLMIMLHPLVMLLSALSFALAILLGGVQVINGIIPLSSFVTFILYLELLTWPIVTMGWSISLFQNGFVSLDRINKILEEKIEIRNPKQPVFKDEISGSLTFNNVNFNYESRDKFSLNNISFEIYPGKTIGIIGRTGSGKSTLLNLIPRVYDICEGSIMIDNTDIKDMRLSILRNSIAYVPQDTFLFSAKITENLDFYRNMTVDRIEDACKTAMIYDEIMSFPAKFDTFVGERGITLSGGQKQRIAIARALLSNAPLLLLDDCLSAVDTSTEQNIIKNLGKYMADKSAIIVSHRIQAVSESDEIIVLENGHILERGTHKKLLKNRSLYYKLYQKQLLEEKLEGEI